MYVDADTHVDETEATWSHMPAEMAELVPRTLEFTPDQMPSWLSSARSSGSGYYRFWFINGELYPRRIRSDERTGTTLGARELVDIDSRLADMDRLGVQQQVLYPTVFLDEITRRPELQVALYHSYNEWIAERCAASGGRLHFVALIPYLSMPDAIKEIRFAKDHGACGLFKLGIECDLPAGDSYFWPAYQVAAELDLPVCIHQGTPWAPTVGPFARLATGGNSVLTWPVVQACSSLLAADIDQRIPDLRVAFVEADCAWLPYVFELAGWTPSGGWRDRERSLANLRFYISCGTGEDIPYLIKVAGGDDNFIIGSDYTHGDRSSVIDAHQRIVERSDLPEKSSRKLTNDNVKALYHI